MHAQGFIDEAQPNSKRLLGDSLPLLFSLQTSALGEGKSMTVSNSAKPSSQREACITQIPVHGLFA